MKLLCSRSHFNWHNDSLRHTGYNARRETLRKRISPATVNLAYGRRIANNCHTVVTARYDADAEAKARLGVLQPAIVECSGMATIDLLARWNASRPFLVSTAATRALANQRVPVAALVAHHRVVAGACEDCLAILGIIRQRTLDRCDHWNEFNNGNMFQ